MSDIVIQVLTLLFSTGLGALSTLLLLRPKKTALEISNMKIIIEELKIEREEDKARIEANEKRIEILVRATHASYRCIFPPDIEKCPVVANLKKLCDENEGVCPVNY